MTADQLTAKLPEAIWVNVWDDLWIRWPRSTVMASYGFSGCVNMLRRAETPFFLEW